MTINNLVEILVNPIPIFTAAMSTFVLAGINLMGQISGSGGADSGLMISGAATTATATALVYVVRQIATGQLVHREPIAAESSLTALVDRVTDLAEQAHKREEQYESMLRKMIADGKDDRHY